MFRLAGQQPTNPTLLYKPFPDKISIHARSFPTTFFYPPIDKQPSLPPEEEPNPSDNPQHKNKSHKEYGSDRL